MFEIHVSVFENTFNNTEVMSFSIIENDFVNFVNNAYSNVERMGNDLRDFEVGPLREFLGEWFIVIKIRDITCLQNPLIEVSAELFDFKSIIIGIESIFFTFLLDMYEILLLSSLNLDVESVTTDLSFLNDEDSTAIKASLALVLFEFNKLTFGLTDHEIFKIINDFNLTKKSYDRTMIKDIKNISSDSFDWDSLYSDLDNWKD